MHAMDATLARRLRRHGARRHRGEHPGAHPRQPADGAVEQARRAAADDRQQVGAGGRLLHALRRHVGRARRHRRRAEDDGLPRGALAERRRAAAPIIPEAIADEGAVGRAPARTRPIRTRCRRTTSSTTSCSATSSTTSRPTTIIAAGFDAATVRRVLRLVRGAEFKRKQAAPGLEGHRPRVRHRLADADRRDASIADL